MNRKTETTTAPRAATSVSVETKPAAQPNLSAEGRQREAPIQTGLLIVNADDWGRDQATTERALECIMRGAVSSASGMVFMADSQRAAGVALERGIDVGLHLNLTTAFSEARIPGRLAEQQQRLAGHLRRHRFAQVIFHPGLASSFDYVVKAQLDEFRRLYGAEPSRLDGHHHMHLCSNVLIGRLLPAGKIVRRNFSFDPGEKNLFNRLYRRGVDGILKRHHRLTDFFFSLPPLSPPGRLQKIFSLARDFAVEVETHPIQPEEYRFLSEGEIFKWAGDVRVAAGFATPLARRLTTESFRRSR